MAFGLKFDITCLLCHTCKQLIQYPVMANDIKNNFFIKLYNYPRFSSNGYSVISEKVVTKFFLFGFSNVILTLWMSFFYKSAMDICSKDIMDEFKNSFGPLKNMTARNRCSFAYMAKAKPYEVTLFTKKARNLLRTFIMIVLKWFHAGTRKHDC